MLEAIGIGLGLFFCIMIGAGIARWKYGRMDLFKVEDEKKPQ
mgnify:CR=1 FL=1|tara:strand:- start:353 stop:478 length:126 start_codon:yes stop_codon:yes gene_type:complete